MESKELSAPQVKMLKRLTQIPSLIVHTGHQGGAFLSADALTRHGLAEMAIGQFGHWEVWLTEQGCRIKAELFGRDTERFRKELRDVNYTVTRV